MERWQDADFEAGRTEGRKDCKAFIDGYGLGWRGQLAYGGLGVMTLPVQPQPRTLPAWATLLVGVFIGASAVIGFLNVAPRGWEVPLAPFGAPQTFGPFIFRGNSDVPLTLAERTHEGQHVYDATHNTFAHPDIYELRAYAAEPKSPEAQDQIAFFISRLQRRWGISINPHTNKPFLAEAPLATAAAILGD